MNIDLSQLITAEDKLKALTPQTVSRAQGEVILKVDGYWDSIVALIEGIEDPEQKIIAEVGLYSTSEWKRQSPTVLMMQSAMEWDDEYVDNLFIRASQITI